MLELPVFARDFSPAGERLTRLGGGPLGGKALGLARARRVIERRGDQLAALGLAIEVPRLVVLGGGFYEEFVARNGLAGLGADGAGDEAIADAFHRAPIPPAPLPTSCACRSRCVRRRCSKMRSASRSPGSTAPRCCP